MTINFTAHFSNLVNNVPCNKDYLPGYILFCNFVILKVVAIGLKKIHLENFMKPIDHCQSNL